MVSYHGGIGGFSVFHSHSAVSEILGPNLWNVSSGLRVGPNYVGALIQWNIPFLFDQTIGFEEEPASKVYKTSSPDAS